jgi:hypothetical protein
LRGNICDAIPVIGRSGQAKRVSLTQRGHRTGGCSFAVDPALDARHASLAWLSSANPPLRIEKVARRTEALTFDPWNIPGRKQLVFDGDGLTLVASSGRHALELRMSDDLAAGDPFDLFVRIQQNSRLDSPSAARSAQWLAGTAPAEGATAASRSSTLHLRALQALDAVQGGASQREVASAVFGVEATKTRWSSDGELRAQTRHLLKRAKALMQGGYRELASLPPP